MHMDPRLLPRKEEETKLTVTHDGRCHAVTVPNLWARLSVHRSCDSFRVRAATACCHRFDQNPGVPDFAMPQLGNKFFYTVHPDGVTKGSGLGLLAIVQQIMALHGGRMVVRNMEPGLRVELHFA